MKDPTMSSTGIKEKNMKTSDEILVFLAEVFFAFTSMWFMWHDDLTGATFWLVVAMYLKQGAPVNPKVE